MIHRRHPDDGSEDDIPTPDDDFVLDLIREPEPPQDVPDSIRAMRARRVKVRMPTGAPSVKEVLLNPSEASGSAQPSRSMLRNHARPAAAGVPCLLVFGLWSSSILPSGLVPPRIIHRYERAPRVAHPAGAFIPLLIVLGWFYVRRATATSTLEPQPEQECFHDA